MQAEQIKALIESQIPDCDVKSVEVQGDHIGTIGATGRVTGPHLDWRINWQQERLDPALLPGLAITMPTPR